MKIKTLTVSELNNYISKIINSNPLLHNFHITGEVFNLRETSYGYSFFSLKDDISKINCIFFSDSRNAIKVGDQLVVEGKLNVYEKNGTYSILVNNFYIDGLGNNIIEYEKIKLKLDKLGYFDNEYKLPIPSYPLNVGIITSIDGAALKDITKLFEKRYPFASLIIFNSKMQGNEAIKQIIEGIRIFNSKKNIDVIIITRGGGSYDELSIFNDEIIAENIFNSNIPIISAIGHEIDYVISDFVADKRASTPSSSVENFFPDINSIKLKLENNSITLNRLINNKLQNSFNNLYIMGNKIEKNKITNKIEERKLILLYSKKIFLNSLEKYISSKSNYLKNISLKLSSFNPIEILEKGYALVKKDKQIVYSVNQLNVNDNIDIVLSDGVVKVKILNKKDETKKNEKE